MRLCETAFPSFPILFGERERKRESVWLDFYRKVISPQPRERHFGRKSKSGSSLKEEKEEIRGGEGDKGKKEEAGSKRRKNTRGRGTNEREEATAREETAQVRRIRSIVTNSANLLKRGSNPPPRPPALIPAVEGGESGALLCQREILALESTRAPSRTLSLSLSLVLSDTPRQGRTRLCRAGH